MQFSSVLFLFLFLPTTVLTYFALPERYRNSALCVFNLLFYCWAEPVAVFLLLGVILFDYGAGRGIHRFRDSRWKKRLLFFFAMAVNILILLVCKYKLFVPKGLVTGEMKNLLTAFLVPMGISVYLFQGMSYIIDLYLNRIKVQKNIISLAVFIAMFWQIVCGPVVRYGDIQSELSDRRENSLKIAKGYSLFLYGLAKKMILGDGMIAVWRAVRRIETEELTVISAWFGIICFGFAMYYYFSGYSEMARGIGKIFGFEIPMNFNYPYISKNIAEFWRRWNISLTVWFKSYIFTPLGKNKNSFFLTIFKLLGIWVLMGLWYGGKPNYILWGLYFGIIIIFEKLFFTNILEKIPVFFQRVYTILLIILGWVIFATDDLTQMIGYYEAMFTGKFIDDTAIYLLGKYLPTLFVCFLCMGSFWHTLARKQEAERSIVFKWIRISGEILLTFLCLSIVISGRSQQVGFFFYF